MTNRRTKILRDWARVSYAVFILVGGILLAGCGASGSTAATSPTPPASTTVHSVPAVLPSWVSIPSIGARSTLVQLGLNPDHTVQVPPVSQPLQAGWYKYSPAPGAIGPAVILGHIDGDHQEGIFWKLHEVQTGDTVQVGRVDGSTLTFTVTKVDEVQKSTFPTDAVYGNTTDPQLRLITCGGAFDAATHSYLDNVIVYASLSS